MGVVSPIGSVLFVLGACCNRYICYYQKRVKCAVEIHSSAVDLFDRLGNVLYKLDHCLLVCVGIECAISSLSIL